jgi:hypothetical protein
MTELMKQSNMLVADSRRLYPELIAHGSLAGALRAALAEIRSALTVSELAIRGPVYARVEMGPRFSQVYIAANERLFVFDFWNRGVMLAQARTADLHETARAIDRWVVSECTTGELAAEFGCVKVKPEASSYERGEEVEQRWRHYLETLPEYHAKLKAFVAAAAAHPKLRQLFPFTSLNSFCFSRCTGYPFTHDTPHVCPHGPDDYEVIGPTGKILGRGAAREAVLLVVSALPPHCGPAVPGTAEDMAKG